MKHRADRTVDAPSLADDPPPVHRANGMVIGRHRAFHGDHTGMVEGILRSLDTRLHGGDWTWPGQAPRDERGSALAGAVLILAGFASFLFALTAATR